MLVVKHVQSQYIHSSSAARTFIRHFRFVIFYARSTLERKWDQHPKYFSLRRFRDFSQQCKSNSSFASIYDHFHSLLAIRLRQFWYRDQFPLKATQRIERFLIHYKIEQLALGYFFIQGWRKCGKDSRKWFNDASAAKQRLQFRNNSCIFSTSMAFIVCERMSQRPRRTHCARSELFHEQRYTSSNANQVLRNFKALIPVKHDQCSPKKIER